MKEFLVDFLNNLRNAIKYGLGIPFTIVLLIFCWGGPLFLAVIYVSIWYLLLYIITLSLAATVWKFIDKI